MLAVSSWAWRANIGYFAYYCRICSFLWQLIPTKTGFVLKKLDCHRLPADKRYKIDVNLVFRIVFRMTKINRCISNHGLFTSLINYGFFNMCTSGICLVWSARAYVCKNNHSCSFSEPVFLQGQRFSCLRPSTKYRLSGRSMRLLRFSCWKSTDRISPCPCSSRNFYPISKTSGNSNHIAAGSNRFVTTSWAPLYSATPNCRLIVKSLFLTQPPYHPDKGWTKIQWWNHF